MGPRRLRRTDGGSPRWDAEAHVYVDDSWWETFLAPCPDAASDDEERPDADLVRECLDRLPDLERDAIYLCLQLGKRQVDAGVILADPPLTQPAVSGLVKAGLRRLRYMLWLATLRLDPELVREALLRAGESEADAAVGAVYYETTSFSETARRLMPGRQWGAQRCRSILDRVRGRLRRRVDRGDTDAVLARVRAWLEGARPLALCELRKSGEWRMKMKAPRL